MLSKGRGDITAKDPLEDKKLETVSINAPKSEEEVAIPRGLMYR